MENPKHSPSSDSHLRVTFAGGLIGLQIQNDVNCINGPVPEVESSIPVMKLVEAVHSAAQFCP